MKNFITVDSGSTMRYDVATYTQFQQEMYRMVDAFDGSLSTVFRITPDFMLAWRAEIDTLVDVNKVIRASASTERLSELDDLRDRALMRLFSGIKAGLKGFSDAEIQAAKRLELIRKPYSGIQKLNYDRETASIDGLLTDLDNAQSTADIATLELTDMLDRVARYNEEFRAEYAKVSDTRALTKLPTLPQMKTRLNPIWEEVVQRIQAAYLWATAANRPKVATLADQMNQRIKQIREAYNRSQSKSGTTKEPTKKAEGE